MPGEVIKVFTKRRPFDVKLDVTLAFDHLLFHRLVQRSHGLALAHDLERYSLMNVALRTAVVNQGFGRPAQHVDETGRNGEAFGVNFRFAASVGQLADGSDGVAIDREVADERRLAAPVVNCAVANNEVELRV